MKGLYGRESWTRPSNTLAHCQPLSIGVLPDYWYSLLESSQLIDVRSVKSSVPTRERDGEPNEI